MAVRTFVPLSSTTFRRILLWGVPSLTLLGLVGAAGVRFWFYRKTRKIKMNNSAIPAASCSREQASPSKCAVASRDHSSGSTDSQQDWYGPEERLNPRKNSEETYRDRFATPFKVHSNIRGKQLTSSNLQLPPQESETPLKPSDLATTGNITAINQESLADESTSSSEGLLLSFSCKSSASAPSAASKTEPSYLKQSSNHIASVPSSITSVMSQLKAGEKEPKEPTASPSNSNTSPLVNRKDRVRVVLQIPRNVVGRFIGKQGRNIKSLMTSSNGAHVYVNQKNLPKDAQIILCTVQGTSTQINDAVNIIAAKYPEIIIPPYLGVGDSSMLHHMSPIPSPHFGTPGQNGESWEVGLLPASIPLGSFSAMVCYLETLTEVWVVTCERSVELEELHQSMSFTYCYAGSDRVTVKEVDESLLGKYCAVKVSEIHWLRGRVTQFGEDAVSYEVQLMDYGSIVIVPPSALKPLRREHSQLPIQAFKVKIAHVEGKEDSMESGLVSLQKMVEGVPLEVHVTGKLPYLPHKLFCKSHFADEKAAGDSEPAAASPSSSDAETATTSEAVRLKTPPSDSPPSCSSPPKHKVPITTTSHLSSDTSAPSPDTGASSQRPPDTSVPGALANGPTSPDTSAPSPDTGASSQRPPDTIGPTNPDKHAEVVELPPLAPYIPLVELYAQVGAQTPLFINRELVELGIASWIEEAVKS